MITLRQAFCSDDPFPLAVTLLNISVNFCPRTMPGRKPFPLAVRLYYMIAVISRCLSPHTRSLFTLPFPLAVTLDYMIAVKVPTSSEVRDFLI